MTLNVDLAQKIGSNIRSIMEERSVTIVELAKALSISRQTLQNYLKGSSIIDSVKLVEIANYFHVSVDKLLDSGDTTSNLLFRTALNYNVAQESICEKVFDTINIYYNLSKSLGKPTAYFPEQYNLIINIDNQPSDINYDCNDYFSSKLKMTSALKKELQNIAYEQRSKLGLFDSNAIAAISALQNRGIHIFFVDFSTAQTFGLSYADEEKGCYIFVNTNSGITLERIIFTVFHEYAHIILHRPLYKRAFHKHELSDRSDFLDKMANRFAGYFLIPEEQLAIYKSIFTNIRSFKQLVPIKQKFQVSLQTLIVAAGNYGYVTPSFVADFFKFLSDNRLLTSELDSIADLPTVEQAFSSVTNERIRSVLQEGYFDNSVDCKTIMDLLWIDNADAHKLISEFNKLHSSKNMFDEFLN